MTNPRPYTLRHTKTGERRRVVARNQPEARSHLAREWDCEPSSAMQLLTDPLPVEYARPEYQPLPAGTPTADDLRMPGDQS